MGASGGAQAGGCGRGQAVEVAAPRAVGQGVWGRQGLARGRAGPAGVCGAAAGLGRPPRLGRRPLGTPCPPVTRPGVRAWAARAPRARPSGRRDAGGRRGSGRRSRARRAADAHASGRGRRAGELGAREPCASGPGHTGALGGGGAGRWRRRQRWGRWGAGQPVATGACGSSAGCWWGAGGPAADDPTGRRTLYPPHTHTHTHTHTTTHMRACTRERAGAAAGGDGLPGGPGPRRAQAVRASDACLWRLPLPPAQPCKGCLGGTVSVEGRRCWPSNRPNRLNRPNRQVQQCRPGGDVPAPPAEPRQRGRPGGGRRGVRCGAGRGCCGHCASAPAAACRTTHMPSCGSLVGLLPKGSCL